MTTPTTQDFDKLWDLIKDTKFGMFTQRDPADGMLYSHPLTTQNKSVDEHATLYFFVPKDGVVAKGIAKDDSVNVAYADTGDDSYVSVAGHAALSEDMAKKKELWSKMAEAWFPKGVDDPNLGLLTVRIATAEYWDVTESKVTQLFKMATAAVTGNPPDLGEHGQVKPG